VTKAGIEHQNSGWPGVRGKYAKHPPLVFVSEMKEAIPSQYPAKSSAERQRPHIADDPLLIRHPGSTQRNKRWGAIHASDAKALRNHVTRNRRSAPAAKIENGRPQWKETKEAFDEGLIKPTSSTAVSIP